MDSTITHILDGVRQEQYVVRLLRKNGSDDHSLPSWNATITIHLKTVVKYMNLTNTDGLDGMRQERQVVRWP